MIVTLRILTDIQGKPTKEGKPRILKKNVKSLRQFETTAILAEQLVHTRGTVSKRWCFVKEGDTYFKVAHKFEEIEAMTKHIVVKGFRQ